MNESQLWWEAFLIAMTRLVLNGTDPKTYQLIQVQAMNCADQCVNAFKTKFPKDFKAYQK